MSAIAGLLAPVGRSAPFGRASIFEDPASRAVLRGARRSRRALIANIGIARMETLDFDTPTYV